ncbi:MAG: 23S rRNA (adenine(2503)-C(2))-methyltransferase RlmN [Clostridia bacterium]|nr:23S rRNA (adenine(2503)-C(2))-methyltransferase RlmN [Clostridia bacterium]
MKKDILSLTFQELSDEVSALGFPKYRSAQIFRWLHKSGVRSFSEMTDLPLAAREQMDYNFVIFSCAIEKKLISAYDSTVKYLFRLHDGEFVESVVMKYKYGYTICVSSQVGCRMGCSFCASTLNGVVRNLYASEILSQLYAAENDLGVRISHIVLMGMGEPLDNYDNVLRFLQLVTDEKGKQVGMRHISLSTCGIVPKIYDLMEKDLQLTLSVSLHAPNDALRSAMMPVNKKWGVAALIDACRAYTERTSRRISFEYALVKGKNDFPECARQLAVLLKGMLCHINLIPVNEVAETGCKRSTPENVKKFADILAEKGYAVTVRRELGADINAACGQLRRSAEQMQPSENPKKTEVSSEVRISN